MRMEFQSFPYATTASFDCPCCGKTKRTRTFKVECTVNPYNKGSDGQPLNASQVRAQSKEKALAEKMAFMTKPLCAGCESSLSYSDRKSLHQARRLSSYEG